MRYLLIFPLALFAALTQSQNPSPRPAPETGVRRPPDQKSKGTEQQPNTEQRGSEQSPFVIKVLLPEQAQNKSQSNSDKGPSNPSESWSLSDKIAVIASIVAFLQFLALVCTVFVI